MRIIEEGQTHKDWKRTINCRMCRAVLEINVSDIKRSKITEYDQRDGEYQTTAFTVNCPCCESQIVVQSIEIPWIVQQRIKS